LSVSRSCEYLRGGLALRYGTVAACGVIHHDRGTPVLGEYRGGPLPIEELLQRRSEIEDGSHPSCTDCPYLSERTWSEPSRPVTWLGITHFNYCNIECEYCWLQWAEYSPRAPGAVAEKPYPILPVIRQLIGANLLAHDAVIDWGGGGEPTIMPDFEPSFELLHAHGTAQWLHTNAVKIPRCIETARFDRGRLRVLCSVDAGRARTYREIKKRDHFETVLTNLAAYARAGAHVAAKYIAVEANSSTQEIDEFIERVRWIGVKEVLGDLDHRSPDASPKVVDALGYLWYACRRARIPFQLGSTGLHHNPESGVDERVALRLGDFANAGGASRF
jgi:sulfatase maturation enzyme AslB (radical SAM superfamily)